MYENKELVITPDFQRLFRWPVEKQSRFIESLILEMPIPPIYAIERSTGVFELIDGLQRLSSYFHFRGALAEEFVGLPPGGADAAKGDAEATVEIDTSEEVEVGTPVPTVGTAEAEFQIPPAGSGPLLTLIECDIVPELNGHTYETLPSPVRFALKRASVRVELIRKSSDPKLRYHMFKRLNTGGETLSEQEVRNCTIRLLSDQFNNFLISLSEYPPYRKSIAHLSKEKISRRYDQECVLRFFAFKNWGRVFKHDLSEFLTEYMEGVSRTTEDALHFDRAEERKVFEKTFDILTTALGDAPFAAVDKSNKVYTNFSVLVFEAFTVGIQGDLGRLDASNVAQMQALGEALRNLRQEPAFRKETVGGGLNYAGPLRRRLELVAKRVATVS